VIAQTCGPAHRRVRPLWLVAALNLATFNLYTVYWLYATWRELKTERADPTMHPVWHALAAFVPVYNLFRLHAHVRVVREQAVAAGVATALSPMACVSVFVLTSLLCQVTFPAYLDGSANALTGLVDLVNLVAATAIVVWAQGVLNLAWYAAPEGPPPARVRPATWAVLAVGTVLWLLLFVVLLLG
jgi:hypothetical protein